MHTAKRVALWGLGILLSSMMVVVLFLVVAGDDFYRWALRQAVEGAIDRDVHVDGTFSLDLGWQPTLSATDVWLANAAWTGKKEMARAERVEIQVALKPLFSGILRVPRLVVQGVDVELEQSAERQRNWDIGRPGGSIEAEALEDPLYPLFDTISLTDITVAYRDRESDREIVLQLDSLEKLNEGVERGLAQIIGAGSVNQRPFKFAARLGTIEDAIAALAPYPLDIELQSTNFTFTASGTVDDLPDAKGLDISLEFRSHSLKEMLRTLQVEGRALGPARASVRLKGDLASLAAEAIDLSIAGPGGEELIAQGRIADLVRGKGLDLEFGGRLDPDSLATLGELPPALQAIVEDLTDLSISGRLAGRFERLELQNLDLRLEHAAGANIGLQGHAVAGLSGESIALFEAAATAKASLPDESLLIEALQERIPPMANLEAVAELAWTNDSVQLRSAKVTGRALEDVQISGKGRIGRLSGSDLTFDLDADLDLEGKSSSSRPLFYMFEGFSPSKWRPVEAPSGTPQASADLILQVQKELIAAGLDPGAADGKMGPTTRSAIEDYQRGQGLTVDGRATAELLLHLQGKATAQEKPARLPPAKPTFPMTEALPELGPINATLRLLFKDQVFRFQDLNLALGSGGTEIKAAGNLGRLHDGPEGILSEIDVQASFALPSSERFADLLPPEAPEFKQISGSLGVTGTENLLSLNDLKAAASGPTGLHATVTGGSTEFDLEEDFEIRSLGVNLDASWPNTRSVYDFIDQELPEVRLPTSDLPELGPVHASVTLKSDGKQNTGAIYALEDVAVSAGAAAQPKLHVTGRLADLVALAGVDLTGDIDLETALLLREDSAAADGELGTLRGSFRISDADGRLGLENLTVGIEDAALLSLALKGQFDDFEQGDGLRLAVSLKVPDLAALGRRLDFDAEKLGDFTYDGELSGSIESFTLKGQAKLGETRMAGDFSGSLPGERPAIKGEVSSPLVRLTDLGMVPDERTLDELLEATEKQPEPPGDEWIFDATPIPFDALKKIDLDLDVVLESVEGVELEVEQIAGKIKLVDGQLSIDPLSFAFVGGKAEAKLRADANEDQPQAHLEFSANNVDLAHLLSQARVEVPLDGTLDVITDLTGKGSSPRDLASSLNGNIQLAIADGHVLTSLLTLTTTNPIRWVFSESARKGYSKMNCLILRFNIENGLAESQTLLLDTPNMLAHGTGRIDLRDETLKIDVIPHAKQKDLLPVSIPFSIEGRLADPSIRVDSASASLRTSKEVLLSPLNLLGSLLPFVGNGSADEDNPCLSLKQAAPTE